MRYKLEKDLEILVKDDLLKTILNEMYPYKDIKDNFWDGRAIIIKRSRVNRIYKEWKRLISLMERRLHMPDDWKNSLFFSIMRSEGQKRLGISNVKERDPYLLELQIARNRFMKELLPLYTFILYLIEHLQYKDYGELEFQDFIEQLQNPDPEVYGVILLKAGVISKEELERRKVIYYGYQGESDEGSQDQ